MSNSQDLMAQRYGKKIPTVESKKRATLLAILGVLGFTSIVGVFALATYNPLSFRDLSYRVESDLSVWVEFEVTAPVGQAVTCDIQALNNQFSVVGHKTIQLPPSQQQVNKYSIRLNTTDLAVTGLVDKCELD